MSSTGAEEREWQTRRRRIDGRLEGRDWSVVPAGSPRRLTPEAITEYETDHGPADYALSVDGRILGVVEAKRLTIGPQNALTQAERYSRSVSGSPFNFDGCRVPFLYSTNGEVIWFHDVRHPLNRSRRVEDFHTPNALREMLDRDLDAECQWLSDHPIKHEPERDKSLRPYQIEADHAIEQAIANRKRQMLIAMATGNGRAKRKKSDSKQNRWRKFGIDEVRERDFKLDGFKWLKDESLEDADDLPEPEELATDAIGELEEAVGELNGVLTLLESGNGPSEVGHRRQPFPRREKDVKSGRPVVS